MKEIDLQRNYLEGEPVETIYFGGGTPSLLTTEELKSLMEKLKQQFVISEKAEVTLETNPDDINAGKIADWKAIGINRLSTGIQSFFEEDLQWMNRAHTASQAEESLALIADYFNNVTVDLIYGSPGLTDEKWKSNVEKVIQYNIPHISCYALTVEPRTALDKLIATGKSPNTNPDHQSEQFLLLMKWLEEAGYEHYEISNFAKPGFRSKHNSSYWKGTKYLGIGPSAHSFNGTERQWNVANNSIYLQSITNGLVPAEKEILTTNQRLNEYIMTALRTMEGIDLHKLEKDFDKSIVQSVMSIAKKYIADKKMNETSSGYLQLTREGRLLADGIASDLFIL